MPQSNSDPSIRRRRTVEGGDGEDTTMGAFERLSTGVGGLVATVLILAVVYPQLAASTKPLHPLSSTAIVTFGVTMWVVVWFVLVVLMLEFQSP